MNEEAVTELVSPAKAKTPVVLKSKPKKLRSNKPSGPAAHEGSLPLRQSKRTTAGKKLETILLEAVKEPLPSSTFESPTGTTGGATVVVENKSMTQKPLKTAGLSTALVEFGKTTMAIW